MCISYTLFYLRKSTDYQYFICTRWIIWGVLFVITRTTNKCVSTTHWKIFLKEIEDFLHLAEIYPVLQWIISKLKWIYLCYKKPFLPQKAPEHTQQTALFYSQLKKYIQKYIQILCYSGYISYICNVIILITFKIYEIWRWIIFL